MTDPTPPSPPAPPKELRIALVCYGGVSLAIYEHGVTKELLKLVRASRAFEIALEAAGGDPGQVEAPTAGATAGWDTEHAYFAAFVAAAGGGGPITAVVDIISGTSAGGINGVCLARALAHGLSVEGFRELWLQKGDLEGLLHGHPIGFSHDQRLASKIAENLISLVHDPRQTSSPLNGALMSHLLFTAFTDMADPAADAAPASLIAPDGSIDLYVTATDLRGYTTAFATGAGGVSHIDRSFRQLLSFYYAPGGDDDFGDDSVAALAFAARATSSFPGAFTPISLTAFCDDVNHFPDHAPTTPITAADISPRFVFGGGFGWAPEKSWYVDGGVLDNGPFDHVINAIAGKRASGATRREIVYIEPDPKEAPGDQKDEATPTWLSTVWSAKVSIPGHNGLAGALEGLRDLNDMIDEVGDLTGLQMAEVLTRLVPPQTDPDLFDGRYDEVTADAVRVRAEAKVAAGITYVNYARLRADAVAESVSHAAARHLGYPPDSGQARFVVEVLQAALQAQPAWRSSDPQQLEELLGPVDVPFRLRRAQFVLQGLNALFDATGDGAPPAADLVRLKTATWDVITRLHGMAGAALAALDDVLSVLKPVALTSDVVLTDAHGYAAANAVTMTAIFQAYTTQLKAAAVGSSREQWETFASVTKTWDRDVRQRLLSRYLAFPIWDAVIFPTVALARLPQLSRIGVSRFSPLDAGRLTPVDADGQPQAHKLKGRAVAHFGGFFAEDWRENDYLWGRLDGAELILDLIADTSGAALPVAVIRRAFDAILSAEYDALDHTRTVIDHLRGQVATLST